MYEIEGNTSRATNARKKQYTSERPQVSRHPCQTQEIFKMWCANTHPQATCSPTSRRKQMRNQFRPQITGGRGQDIGSVEAITSLPCWQMLFHRIMPNSLVRTIFWPNICKTLQGIYTIWNSHFIFVSLYYNHSNRSVSITISYFVDTDLLSFACLLLILHKQPWKAMSIVQVYFSGFE